MIFMIEDSLYSVLLTFVKNKKRKNEGSIDLDT